MSGPLHDLSIIIPTHAARAASLQRVLAAMAVQTLPREQFEMVVSVDGEGEGPEGEWPFALRVVQGPREGPGAARNRGAAAARGAVLVFLDDDIVPAAGWAAGHWEVQHGLGGGKQTKDEPPKRWGQVTKDEGRRTKLAWPATDDGRQKADDKGQRREAEGMVVGLGKITLPARATRTLWERYLTARYDEHFVKMGRRGYAPTFWDCLSGSLSVRRELLERVGGFDSTFTRHEDVELGLRLAEAGARFVYAPEAAGEHQYRRGLAAGLVDAVGEGESAGVLIRWHPALAEKFAAARWRRYGPVAKLALRRVLADVGRHARALGVARAWLERVDASPLPFVVRRPVYQWAYHLHFWEGMRRSAPEVVVRVGRDGQ